MYSLLALLGVSTSLFGQQLPVTTYSIPHGLSHPTVYCLLQDARGFIWVGTQEGVCRFDGKSFSHFTADHGLAGNRVSSIAQDSSGVLWFGTDRGLSTYDGDSMVTVMHSGPVFALLISRDASVLAGTSHGVFRSSSPDWRKTDSTHGATYAMLEDREGTLWLGTDSGLVKLGRGNTPDKELPNLKRPVAVKSLLEDRSGVLWVGTDGQGLWRRKNGAWNRLEGLKGAEVNHVYSSWEARDGVLWFGTYGGGVIRYEKGAISVYASAHGLPSPVVRAVVQDREGNMWFGTYGGIVRLGRQRMLTFTAAHGLGAEIVMAVAEGPDGAMWFGTYGGGVTRVRESARTTFTARNGLAHNTVRAILPVSSSEIWFGTHGGLCLMKDGKFTTYTKDDGLPHNTVLSLASDSSGGIWVGTFGGGACHFKNGVITILDAASGLPNNVVRSIAVSAGGDVWFGTDGGVLLLEQGRTTSLTPHDGLPHPVVRSISVMTDGKAVFSTDGGGVCTYMNGNLDTLNTSDGLSNNVCYFAVEDSLNTLWIGTNKGITRIGGGRVETYTVEDGLPSNQMNSGAALKDSRGRMWFGSTKGVTMLTPEPPAQDPVHPLVHITRVLVRDMEIKDFSVPLRMRHDQNTVQLDFLGLWFSAPGKLRYRYMLEGLDEQWDESVEHSVKYSSLPPGEYTFTVQALAWDKDMNPSHATLRLAVMPPYWATWWFRGLVLAAILTGAGSLYRWRIATLNRQREAQEEFARRLMESQESDRKRIAAAIHDSLGQNLLVLQANLQEIVHEPTLGNHFRKDLDELAGVARDAIDEVREIAFDLHPHVLDRLGLKKAIETMVEKVFQRSSIAVSVDLCDTDGILHGTQHINIYRIVQECLSNIMKHSRAKNATVTLTNLGPTLELVIADDGSGFDAAGQSAPGKSRGSFGLINITERVRQLRGMHELRTSPGHGTSWRITLPSGGAHS